MYYTKEVNLSSLLLYKNISSDYLPLQKKYRSHFEIIASMLEVARNNGGVVASSFLRHSGMSYRLLRKYLDYLTETGFIKMNIKEGKVLYRVSVKGLAFLRQYYILQEMLIE